MSSASFDRATLRQQLLRRSQCRLCETHGRVEGIRVFTARHLELLSAAEREVVAAAIETLAEQPPPEIEAPLRLSNDPDAKVCAIPYRLDGARSARLPSYKLHLKGARPLDGGGGFPTESVDPVTGELVVDEIPFGVLTAEGVLREVLGFVFTRNLGLPTPREPVGVISYSAPFSGHALLMRGDRLQRVEGVIAYPSVTLAGLVAAAMIERAGGPRHFGETELRGLDRAVYLGRRAELYSTYLMAGGFRGLLNANLGNDVIGPLGELAWVDFDTFHLRPVPAADDAGLVREYLLHAAIENIRTCLPVASYAPLGTASIADFFESRSTSFGSAWAALKRRLVATGYSARLIDDHWTELRELPAVVGLMHDGCVSGQSLLDSYAPSESLYVAHGPPETATEDERDGR